MYSDRSREPNFYNMEKAPPPARGHKEVGRLQEKQRAQNEWREEQVWEENRNE